MQKHNDKTINKIHWPKIWNELPEKIKLCKSKYSSLNNNQIHKLLRRSSFNIFCWSSFSYVSGKQLNNLKIFNFTMVKKNSRKVLQDHSCFYMNNFFSYCINFPIYCYYFALVFIDFFKYVFLCWFRVFFT